MDKYSFVLLRYLICVIKSVSPKSKIINHEIDDESCHTSRDVVGSLDVLALIAILKAKGCEFSLEDWKSKFTMVRDGLDCSLVISLQDFDGVTSFSISTWAFPHTEWTDDIDW